MVNFNFHDSPKLSKIVKLETCEISHYTVVEANTLLNMYRYITMKRIIRGNLFSWFFLSLEIKVNKSFATLLPTPKNNKIMLWKSLLKISFKNYSWMTINEIRTFPIKIIWSCWTTIIHVNFPVVREVWEIQLLFIHAHVYRNLFQLVGRGIPSKDFLLKKYQVESTASFIHTFFSFSFDYIRMALICLWKYE